MVSTPQVDFRKIATAELLTYLQDGTVNPDALARSFDYEGLDIKEFERLLEIHFVLHPAVVSYVRALDDRLRRIKTEHEPHEEVLHGEVRGVINWNQTFARRMAAGFEDRSLFVVNDPRVQINIAENRIVKKLLSVIERTLSEEIEGRTESWASRWDDDQIVRLQQTVAHNVYLADLPDPGNITVDDREINIARRSRHDLYAEGARLLRIHRDLQNNRFDRSGVRDFLRETLISPVADHRMFELFCLFGLVHRLERLHSVQIGPIESRSGPLVRMEGDEQVVEVYHDEGGPLQFFEAYPPSQKLRESGVPEFICRHADALEEHDAATGAFLKHGRRQGFFDGRPDFLVLVWEVMTEARQLQEAIIGEVKLTSSADTFSSGLRELLEYMQLARESNHWVRGEAIHDDSLHGVLCTNGVDTATDHFESIHHWTTEEIVTEYNQDVG